MKSPTGRTTSGPNLQYFRPWAKQSHPVPEDALVVCLEIDYTALERSVLAHAAKTQGKPIKKD